MIKINYMKTKLIITVIAMVLMALDLQAQTVVADNMVGFNHQIKSEVLGEDREVQIYLPPSYQDAEKEYPVIYVLDGQRFFLHTVSLSQSFQQFQLAPEFIIVGIKNSYPHRFRHFGEGRENFKIGGSEQMHVKALLRVCGYMQCSRLGDEVSGGKDHRDALEQHEQEV